MNSVLTVAIFCLAWTVANCVLPSPCNQTCCEGAAGVTRVSIESTKFPGFFWRTCKNNYVYIDDNQRGIANCENSDATFRQESTFLMHEPGLTGSANTASFESVKLPGFFLRHGLYYIYLEKGTAASKVPNTFNKLPGRLPEYGNFIFQTTDYPDYLLRNCRNWQLRIDNTPSSICPASDSVYLAEASFRVTTPLY